MSKAPQSSANRRDPDPPRIILTARRQSIIKSVNTYRWLTASLIHRLHFRGNMRLCRRELKLLYDHAYLGRAEQYSKRSLGPREYVYHLPRPRDLWKISRNGKITGVKYPETVEGLQETLGIEEKELHQHLNQRQYDGTRKWFGHPLAINTIRIYLEFDARAQGFTISEWIDDPTLKQRGNYDSVKIPQSTFAAPSKTEEIPLIPDGYYTLECNDIDVGASFFIEADHKSNLSIHRWIDRAKGYMIYFSSGAYTQRYGTDSLRVLTGCSNKERVQKLQRATEKAATAIDLAELAPMFFFTTYALIEKHSPLTEPIWAVSGVSSPQRIMHTPAITALKANREEQNAAPNNWTLHRQRLG